MDVTCNRCSTVYEFDAGLIAPSGTTVKCTECGHLFKIYRASAHSAAGEEPRSWPNSWRIRKPDGTQHLVESLAEVMRLISAGHFHPDDEISRTGQHWKRLGGIAELEAIFQAAKRRERRTSGHAVVASDSSKGEAPNGDSAERRPTEPRPRRASPVLELSAPRRERRSSATVRPVASAPEREPEPQVTAPAEARTVPMPARGGEGRSPQLHTPLTGLRPATPLAPPSSLRHYVGMLSIAGALVVSGSVAALVLSPPHDKEARALPSRVEQIVDQADQALATHRPSGFELAIRNYERALQLDPDNATTLSSISRAHAIWSQWLKGRLGPPERADKLLASEAEELQSQARHHAEEARQYAQRAMQLSSARGSVGVAWSDALRLGGDLREARAALEHAQADDSAPRAEALRVAALLAIDDSGGNASAGQSLAEQAVSADPSLLRTRFLLLHCLIGANALEQARTQLHALQQLDPTHPSLPALASQVVDAQARAGY